jgi:hypothetical protein
VNRCNKQRMAHSNNHMIIECVCVLTHLTLVVEARAAQRVIQTFLGVFAQTAIVLLIARPADLSVRILRIR